MSRPAAAFYQVQYRTVGAADWTLGGTTAAKTIVVTGLNPDLQYEFRVVPVSSDNRVGSSSSTATARPGRAAALVPQSLTATALDAAVDLDWVPASTGGPATEYEVQYRTSAVGGGSAGSWSQSVTTSGTTREITGLTNGVSYDFRVRAVWTNPATNPFANSGRPGFNSAVYGTTGTRQTAWIPADGSGVTVAAVPLAVASESAAPAPQPQPPVTDVTTGPSEATITTDVANFAGQTYEYSTNNGSSWTTASVSSGSPTFTVSGLSGVADSTHIILVRRRNGASETGRSRVTLTRRIKTYGSGQIYAVAFPAGSSGPRQVGYSLIGGAGGSGGNDSNSGGAPGSVGDVNGLLPVGSGDSVQIAVGSGGTNGTSTQSLSASPVGGAGGVNPLSGTQYKGGVGGAVGRAGASGRGGGGGAASVLRVVSNGVPTLMVVAAGGGGGGGADSRSGGGGQAGQSYSTAASDTNGGEGARPSNIGNDDGGGGGGGGGGHPRGGAGGASQRFDETGVFTKTFYYRGRGGQAGQSYVNPLATGSAGSTSRSAQSAGSATIQYLEPAIEAVAI